MTTFTHPQTRQQITTETIDRLIASFRTSTSQRQRDAIHRQLLSIGVTLKEIADDLERRLERGYQILEAAPDEAREDRWAAWAAAYEMACDALSRIDYIALSDRPDLVTQRREMA